MISAFGLASNTTNFHLESYLTHSHRTEEEDAANSDPVKSYYKIKLDPQLTSLNKIVLEMAVQIDCSGSMNGSRIRHAKDSALHFLANVKERLQQRELHGANVSLWTFGTYPKLEVTAEWVDGAFVLTDLYATEESISSVKTIEEAIRRVHIHRECSTNSELALSEAVSYVSNRIARHMPAAGQDATDATHQGLVLHLTDGHPTAGCEDGSLVSNQLQSKYIGNLPISLACIALSESPQRHFLEPIFKKGRFAFAENEQELDAAFARLDPCIGLGLRNMSVAEVDQTGKLVKILYQGNMILHEAVEIIHDSPKFETINETTLPTQLKEPVHADRRYTYMQLGSTYRCELTNSTYGTHITDSEWLPLSPIYGISYQVVEKADLPHQVIPPIFQEALELRQAQEDLNEAVLSSHKDSAGAAKRVESLYQQAVANRGRSEGWDRVCSVSRQVSLRMHSASSASAEPPLKRLRAFRNSSQSEDDEEYEAPPDMPFGGVSRQWSSLVSYELCSTLSSQA